MDTSELSNVAWDLVDHCRSALTDSELSAAYVRLGIGEHGEAMTLALTPFVRAGGPPLPEELLGRLTNVARVYYLDRDLTDLVGLLAARP